jgi:hypothetical protein
MLVEDMKHLRRLLDLAIDDVQDAERYGGKGGRQGALYAIASAAKALSDEIWKIGMRQLQGTEAKA